MARVHVKKALFLLDRVHLFAIQKEGDGSLQQEINVSQICLKALLFVQRNNHHFSFFHRLVFFVTCLCCTGVQELKCFYSTYRLFPHAFYQNILIEQ